MTVRRAATLRFADYSLDEIFGACLRTLGMLGMDVTGHAYPNHIDARARMSMASNGENIGVDVSPDGVVVVRSASRVRLTVFDWGKNELNVSSISHQLTVLMPPKTLNISGDYITAAQGATVINRSYVMNALNSLPTGSRERAALQELADLVQRSGNDEAVEQFNALTGHISGGTPNKSVLRALLDGMTKALPSIGEISKLASEIINIASA